ncbi:MAG: DUF1788 domain-containing protein [Patescibacteria group bacterium]|nr:DUF1788 domain-containing protein [Patescibacteria group bacterium]
MTRNIRQELDQIIDIISTKDFLNCSSLGNEIGFYIYDYPPEEEMLVRTKIKNIKKQLQVSRNIEAKEFDLYKILLKTLEDKGLKEKIIKEEKKKGFEWLIKALKPILKPETYKDVIASESKDADVIFLSGVGKVWPFIRSHTVLNNLHSIITAKPLLMFYPGEWNQKTLKLFGKFKDDNYYRAFKLFN